MFKQRDANPTKQVFLIQKYKNLEDLDVIREIIVTRSQAIKRSVNTKGSSVASSKFS